jgi:predicted CXXCH cytochrome family protein
MTRVRHSSVRLPTRVPVAAWLGLAALVAGGFGCAKLETEKPPTVTTAGPHAVAVGATVTLSATTANGKDAAYTLASADPGIATVDAQGLVTGVGVGETAVVFTGATTKATASHAIVVVAASLTAQIPYYDKWAMSAHADATALAFNNWNTPGTVPVECARCHSSEGFVDYLGGDGSAPGVVDKPAPAKSLIRCQTCHNPAADALTSVTFPSGVVVDGLGGEARCMTCHQGRASGAAVDAAIKKAAVTSDDQVSAALSFQNIHYYPAAATLFAGRAKGGYQYAGQVYDVRFRHVVGFDTCIGCHDPHSTKVKFDACVGCHAGATDVTGAHAIRMMSSVGRDYDGDGNVTEGVYDELVGLRDKLLTAVRTYGAERLTPICYTPATYPYWFADTDGDGTCSAGEAVATNAFKSWTARLVRATYDFQMATKDPGAFAHNAKYIIELLSDAIADVNPALVVKVDMSKAVRGDVGHFDGAGEPARHWDAGEKVDATCSSCHGGQQGFRFYVQYGVGKIIDEPDNGLECGTCHDKLNGAFDVAVIPSVTFPSGVTRTEPGHDNLCESCHRGREARVTVDAKLAAAAASASGKLAFINVHYLPAGATKLGAAVHVGYEYDGKTYAGPLAHAGGTQCTSCHDPKGSHHTFQIADAWTGTCKACHADADGDSRAIRLVHLLDYDGDGSATEPLAAEVDGLAARVLGAMQATAAAPGPCYAPGAYPYFFKDTNGDKTCGAAESVSANGFTAWTPALVKAAFNYQLSRTDPGAWAHNFDYIAQLLIDSVADLGGDVTTLHRP